MLEERLDEVDQEESNLLFLGKSRCDHNPNRISLLSQIEACLADYGIRHTENFEDSIPDNKSRFI
jgi:hypothetical protein